MGFFDSEGREAQRRAYTEKNEPFSIIIHDNSVKIDELSDIKTNDVFDAFLELRKLHNSMPSFSLYDKDDVVVFIGHGFRGLV
jgi:hypothetical protein